MVEMKDNISAQEQECKKEESILSDNHLHTSSLTASENVEIVINKDSADKKQSCSNAMQTEDNFLAKSDIINHCNKINDEIEVETNTSLLTDEHSYANVSNEIIDESNVSSNVVNNSSNDLIKVDAVLPMNTIDSEISNKCEQNQNDCFITKDESMHIVNHEVIITEEIINIDNDEFNKSCTNEESINNVNLTNENVSDNESNMYYIDKRTSLDAIALQYDSSDCEDGNNTEKITNIPNNKVYRNKDEVVLTSDTSSDSESDSSSSESDSDSDSSDNGNNKNSSESDDENQTTTTRNKTKKVFKPKGEFDDLPPIEDLKISVPEVLCDPLGEVAWTVEQMVVVRPKPGKPTLNLDTILFIEKGQRALGHIFDVFGQVAEPHYCVRFNSSDHIRESDIKVGMTVYYCPNTQYTSLVFLSELTKMKAVDEIGDDEPLQFSDDEEEQAYLASLKNKSNNKAKETSSEVPNKRKRGNKTGWQSNHPWNSNREHQQNHNAYNPRPFYRTQHPWSRPRYQAQNPWHQYNSYPNNQWMARYPAYNEMQGYNEYLGPAHVPQMEMQNTGFSQVQWNPHFQLPQMNSVPLQNFPQTTLVPPFSVPPPPPPPPPPNANT